MADYMTIIEEWMHSDGVTGFSMLRYTSGGYVVTCWKGNECHWWLEFDTEAKANAEFEKWRGT